MKKGKNISINTLENYISTEENPLKVIVVSCSGYEKTCYIAKESYEDAKADLESRFVEFYEVG